jgi:hypothetical protein
MSTTPASSASVFDPEFILAKYPIPIARTFQAKLQEPPSPLHRLLGLTDVFEVTLKYCAIIAIQEYLRLGLRSPAVDEEIALHFRIPSLGSWNAFLREVLRSFRGLQDQLLMPALVNFYFAPAARQNQRIDELINLRNRLAHSARRSDEEAEEEYEKHWPQLASVLTDLRFLASYDLILHDDDGTAHLLMGTEPKTIELPAAAASLPRGQLGLVHGERMLPLSPLLLHAKCGYPTRHGPCELSKIFFFNSVKRKPDFLDYSMAHHRWASDVSERLRAIIEKSAEKIDIAAPEGASAASWELLQERSEDMVGRVSEELQLLEFIASRPRGFLVVEGDPGIGKTALLSRVVHDLLGPKSSYGRSEEVGMFASHLHDSRLNVAFHLCGADKSSLELSAIMSSLINQLPASGGATTGVSADLANAARATVEQTRGKLLLVIDGVDEALVGRTDAERQNIVNTLLFEGERLPSNVFVLLGTRRGAIQPLRDPEVPAVKMELSGLPEREIRRLLFRVVSKYDLEDRHVEAVARVSAGNPLYIRMLAEDFAQGRLYLEDVDHLPLGIEGYFEKLLLRFASNSQWPVLRDTLLLLALAHGPLTIAQIAAIARQTQPAVEAAVDNELTALLSESETAERTPTFRLFHAKFPEFLLTLFAERLPATAKRMNEARADDAAVSSAHLEHMQQRILEYCGKWAEVQDTYPLRYYSGHLYETGASGELERLLTKTNFLEEKIRRLDDPFLAADDVSYLVRVLLGQNRDSDIVALATRDEGFYRDGVASGLRAAAGIDASRITAIVQRLLEVSRLGLIAALRGRELPPPALNARRVAIEVAYHYGLGDQLEAAALDRSRAVRILAGPYLYRFWKKETEPGWKLLDNIAGNMVAPIGLPNFTKIESCTLMSVMIMIHHSDDAHTLERVREPWIGNVKRLERLAKLSRLVLPPALFVFQYALRHMMAQQADFQPVNLPELLAMFTNSRQIPSRKLGVECLAEMESLDGGCERTIQALLDKRTAFDVFLMQVAERVLFLHGCRDPERIMQAMSRIYRDGCPWFHQSVLYTSFHILRSVPAVEDSLLEEYKSLTRETIAESRGLFITPNGKYPLLPHMGWAEIIFDQHRPTGKAQFIPQFYREAIGLGDIEYARRALRATGVLSHSYDRHDLALLALEDAAAAPKPQLRETLVDLLANIRFYDEAAVDRFLAQHAGPDLATRVLSATPSIRSADTFNWIDSFVNAQMLASEQYRLQVAATYRSAGTSKSLSQGMARVLKHVMNMIAGRVALEIGGNE